MSMRVFFNADCEADHARDNGGKRWDKGQPDGKDEPEGKQLETLAIYKQSNELWIQIGSGAGSWYGAEVTGNNTLKVWFDGSDGSVLRALWPGPGGVVKPGDPGGRDDPPDALYNSFEMWKSCCWIKLGNRWYCLPC